MKKFRHVYSSFLPSSGNCKAHAVSCASCARADCRCRSDRSLDRRRMMWSGGKPIVRGFAIFFRIRRMLGSMSTGVGRRIRADAERDRGEEPAAHPGYIGWEEFMANQRRLADN